MSFILFFQQSCPPLEVLDLYFRNVAMPGVQLNGILSCLPTLKCLSLNYDPPEFGDISPTLWQHLRESECPTDDTQPESEGTFNADRRRSSSPARPQICPRLEYLKVNTDWSVEHHSLDDVAGFIVSRCSPSDDDYRSSVPQSHGINLPILREVSIKYCDFEEDEFLEYPGIDKCLNNGFNVSFQENC